MGKCLGCGKKLGWFEGYSFDDERWCDDCYSKRNEILKKKEHKITEDKPEKAIEKKDTKEETKGNQGLWWIILILIILGALWLFGVLLPLRIYFLLLP